MTDYKTILTAWKTETEVKKSRFVNFVFHVEDEAAVESILIAQRKKHYKATHHCFAYVLNTNPKRQKSSDDGEPAGTAGKPILAIINQRELTNILVIVVRYFGGVKLGTGGLVRAYSGGAVDVLNNAQIIAKKFMDEIQIVLDYSLYGSLINQLSEIKQTPIEEKFTDKVTLAFQIPLAKTPEFVEWLEDQTSGNFEIKYKGQKYVDVKEG